jgi:hypothetical protein
MAIAPTPAASPRWPRFAAPRPLSASWRLNAGRAPPRNRGAFARCCLSRRKPTRCQCPRLSRAAGSGAEEEDPAGPPVGREGLVGVVGASRWAIRLWRSACLAAVSWARFIRQAPERGIFRQRSTEEPRRPPSTRDRKRPSRARARLSRASIADEMREEHRQRVLGE